MPVGAMGHEATNRTGRRAAQTMRLSAWADVANRPKRRVVDARLKPSPTAASAWLTSKSSASACNVPQRYAPVGPLSPRAVFLRLIARMATVAVVRLASRPPCR